MDIRSYGLGFSPWSPSIQENGKYPGVWRQKDFSGQVGRKENLQGQPEGISSALSKQKRGLMTGEPSQWLQVNG